MNWTKLGDEYPDAAAELPDAAFRTHTEALCWSNRRLLDLQIPKRDLKRFAETGDAEQAAKELVESGWWQDCGDTWWIGCRFSEWQLERSVVERRRELSKERVKRHRLHVSGDHSHCLPESCNALHDALRDALPGSGRVGSGTDATEKELTRVRAREADKPCDRCSVTPTRVHHSGARLCVDHYPHDKDNP